MDRAKHANCYKFCSPKPLNGKTIKVTCELNGEQIECFQGHKPGTIVHVACALGYRKPANRIFTDLLRCGENGEWDYPPFRCEQVCGTEGRICFLCQGKKYFRVSFPTLRSNTRTKSLIYNPLIHRTTNRIIIHVKIED